MTAAGTEPAMRAFRIAYDGRPYHGWQRQPDVETVEDALLDALRALEVTGGDPPPGYAAAGRADAGVSAIAQTVAFEAPDWLTPSVIAHELPDDIWVYADAPVDASFHATHDADERTYVYYLRGDDDGSGSWEAYLDNATEAARVLSGTHDFHNLTPDDTGTTRDVTIAVTASRPYLVCTVSADGFPRQLVRRLITVIHDYATEACTPSDIDAILAPEPIDGPAGVAPAPASPLVLADVSYPSVSFRHDATAVSSMADTFRQRAHQYETRAHVARHLTRPD